MSIRTFFKETVCVQKLISLYKSHNLKRAYYNEASSTTNSSDKTVIFMIDGKIGHGGLCDRLHGLISTFLFCEENGLQFRVWWKYPFNLELFLQPNTYNWHIDKFELTYNKSNATPYYWGTIHNEHKQLQLAQKILQLPYTQIHAYTNMHYKREQLHRNFQRLFKLSPILRDAVNRNLQSIGPCYISATFRFQRLLGDFDEGNFPVLDNSEKTDLMVRCKNAIEAIKKEHPSTPRILVTSDSKTFLNYLSENLSYTYTIDGELCHMDFIKNESNELRHIKSFVDLIMISKAQTAYLVRTTPMYKSSFAKTAALIGNVPYIEYDF